MKIYIQKAHGGVDLCLAGRLSGTGTVMSQFKDDKLQTFHLTSAESNSAFMLNLDNHFFVNFLPFLTYLLLRLTLPFSSLPNA